MCCGRAARGARLPAFRRLVTIDDGALIVLERLTGRTDTRVGEALVDDLLAHVELQADLVSDGDGFHAHLRRSLTSGLDGYCLHASLRDHSDASRRLLERVRAAGRALENVALTENDAVHWDLHRLNVLQADGRLTGLVDVEGYRTGDRAFDLVTLAFGLAGPDCPPATAERFWARAFALRDRVSLTAYVAHLALRQVDWSIRHRTAADVEFWLGHADAAFERCGDR